MTISRRMLLDPIKKTLAQDSRVVFAYLFGSSLSSKEFHDIDIGVYCVDTALKNPFDLTSDLKIALSEATGFPPDHFDITLINALMRSDRMDSLLTLGNIFEGILLVDRDPSLRTDLIEKVSRQFRESEGILQEIFP